MSLLQHATVAHSILDMQGAQLSAFPGSGLPLQIQLQRDAFCWDTHKHLPGEIKVIVCISEEALGHSYRLRCTKVLSIIPDVIAEHEALNRTNHSIAAGQGPANFSASFLCTRLRLQSFKDSMVLHDRASYDSLLRFAIFDE